MKIRTDFVTNSSSSSFIIGFASDDELQHFSDTFPAWLKDEIVDEVVNDVNNNMISKDAAIEYYRDEISEYDLGFHGKNWLDLTWEEIQSAEFQQFATKKKDEMAAEFAKEIDGFKYFAEVEYEDHDQIGSVLEHDVMPYLPNTIRRFSHH